MKLIFLVEDDDNLRKLLMSYLEKEGYHVIPFAEGYGAEAAIEQRPDLWILDIMLPGIDGYSLLKTMKHLTPEVPVLFMSARSAELDRVIGLELGCDDYLPKPFLPRELVLRVNRLLKASQVHASPKSQAIVGPYRIQFDQRLVLEGEEELILTVKEFEVLIYLIEHVDKALSRSQIIDSVWGRDYFGSERVVDDALRRLRKKMPHLLIEAVYGYGYRFRLE